jgi:hypothetical protein
MKRNTLLTVILTFVLVGLLVTPALAQSSDQADLARVRNATAGYHDIPTAKAAGYNLVPGLDSCFNNPGVGGMGFHLINGSILDTIVDPLKPEALVYAPIQDGKLRLSAVEYVVPAGAWDASHSQPPVLFGRSFEFNQGLGVYALHAWIWKPNPLGMFNDWNPAVSCN